AFRRGAEVVDELLEFFRIEAAFAGCFQLLLKRLDLGFGDGGSGCRHGAGIERSEQVANALLEQGRATERAARLVVALGLLDLLERFLQRLDCRVPFALRQTNPGLVIEPERSRAADFGVFELAIRRERGVELILRLERQADTLEGPGSRIRIDLGELALLDFGVRALGFGVLALIEENAGKPELCQCRRSPAELGKRIAVLALGSLQSLCVRREARAVTDDAGQRIRCRR